MEHEPLDESSHQALDPYLASLLNRARETSDPDTGLALLRKFGELLSRQIAPRFGLKVAEYETWAELLKDMQRAAGRAERAHFDALHRLRKSGNAALHDEAAPAKATLDARIEDAKALRDWFTSAPTAKGAPKAKPEAKREAEAAAPTPTDMLASPTGLVHTPLPHLIPLQVQMSDPWAQLTAEGISLVEALAENASNARLALADGQAQIAGARAPFRLGIVGEFRVGKSTLINALAGADLAPTGVVETTHLITRYRHSEREQGTIRFLDGTEQVMTLAEAHAEMVARRDDAAWSATVDLVDIEVRAPRLDGLELWDAPGLGGSDANEAIANRFIDSIGGAIWLFDAELLGDDLVMGPLRRLARAEKAVLGAINRADQLDEDQIEEACAFLREMSGDLVCDVVAISALTMRDDDAARGRFRAQIDSVILQSAEVDRDRRIQAAIGQAAHAGASALAGSARRLRDRAGLSALLRENVNAAYKRTLTGLDAVAEGISARAFYNQERSALAALNQLFVSTDGTPKAKAIDQLIARLDSATHVTDAWPEVVAEMTDVVETRWVKYTQDAVSLTRAAVPSTRFARVEVPNVEAREAEHRAKVKSESDEVGFNVAWMGAGALGILAAASVTITWPIMLAALPLGVLASEQQAIAGMNRHRVVRDDIASLMREMLNSKRAVLLDAMKRELPDHLSAILKAQVGPLLQRIVSEALGTSDVAAFRERLDALEVVIDGLQGEVNAHLGSDHDLGGIVEPDEVRVAADATTGPTLARFLSGLRGGLDLITQGAEIKAAVLLGHLRAGLDVRWICTSRADGAAQVAAAMRRLVGDWPGRLAIRVVSDGAGAPLAVSQVSLISSDGAWICPASEFAALGRSPVTLRRAPLGQLAAQRRFAQLWTGLSSEGQLRVEVG